MFKGNEDMILPLFRVGSGYDVHRFSEEEYNKYDNNILLCGVKVPHNKKVIAHSDGDVAIHALVDAILGAIGCGDIGDHFPSSDDNWKNHDSLHFLSYAVNKIKDYGYLVSNIDITIICEAPRISPYKLQMKTNISELLNISQRMVNIKSTTSEALGFIGRGEGIAVQAVVGCTLFSQEGN